MPVHHLCQDLEITSKETPIFSFKELSEFVTTNWKGISTSVKVGKDDTLAMTIKLDDSPFLEAVMKSLSRRTEADLLKQFFNQICPKTMTFIFNSENE